MSLGWLRTAILTSPFWVGRIIAVSQEPWCLVSQLLWDQLFIFGMNKIMWLAYCTWHTSHLQSINVTKDRVSFFVVECATFPLSTQQLMSTYIVLIFGYVNSTVMTMKVQISLQHTNFIYSGNIPSSEVSGSFCSSVFHILMA
jgi:hypothetical protein